MENQRAAGRGEAGGVEGWGRVLTLHEQIGDTRLGRGYHRATPGVVAEDE